MSEGFSLASFNRNWRVNLYKNVQMTYNRQEFIAPYDWFGIVHLGSGSDRYWILYKNITNFLIHLMHVEVLMIQVVNLEYITLFVLVFDA